MKSRKPIAPEIAESAGMPWLVHLLIVSVTFLAMLGFTWMTWPDPLVDFGRELYVPWQLTQGKALYRDIAYFNGPLSPHLNALFFKFLGVSLRTLVLMNSILLALLTGMIWYLWRRMSDAITATAACVVLLTVFSFIQLLPTGNYNFITPYSHEMTHGVILSFAAIVALWRFIDRRQPIKAGIIGVLLGLIFLTKAEIFLAAFVAVTIGFFCARPAGKSILYFFVALLIPPMLSILFLSLRISPTQAVRGTLGSWVYVFDPAIRGMHFYRRIMGTLDLSASRHAIEISSLAYVAVLAPAVLIALFFKRGFAAILGVGAATAIALFFLIPLNFWQSILCGCTLAIPAIALVTLGLAIRRPLPNSILRATVSLFAAILLAKIFFDVRAMQYGFALAMPAALVLIAAAIGWGPAVIDRFSMWGDGVRAFVLPLIALGPAVYLYIYARDYHDKRVTVGAGSNAFLADPANTRAPSGLVINLILKQLQTLAPTSTLAVFPEGAMINYLAGRTNPTPYITLMPPEVKMFGDDSILEGLSAHPPDFILVQKMSALSEYDSGDFETGYGVKINQWVRSNYQPAPISTSPTFPAMLYKRR